MINLRIRIKNNVKWKSFIAVTKCVSISAIKVWLLILNTEESKDKNTKDWKGKKWLDLQACLCTC